jgi:glycerol uptake facilitator-like aquaporin
VSILQRTFAEALGTALLVLSVVSAGFMTAALGAEGAVALLMIGLTVGFMLFVIISVFGPVSGGHFNPAVSLALAIRKDLPWNEFLPYVLAQVIGGIVGAIVSNVMFGSSAIAFSAVERTGAGQWVGETVATFGLVMAVLVFVARGTTQWIPAAVGVWVAGGHIFTSSTSFANPAVTIGRIFTDAGTGISAASSIGFISFEIVGALLAVAAASVVAARKSG